MATTIKLKRGLKANLPTLAVGEPAFCTDTSELFIGTAGGNVNITGSSTSSGQTEGQAYYSLAGLINYSALLSTLTETEVFIGNIENSRYVMENNSTTSFIIMANAINTATSKCATIELKGSIKRGASASAMTISTIEKDVIYTDDALYDFNAYTDTTNGALKLMCTNSVASNTIWKITMTYSSVSLTSTGRGSDGRIYSGSFSTTNESEIFIGGVNGSRYILNNNSLVSFKMLVSAIDTVNNETAGYEIKGCIKRGASASALTLSTIEHYTYNEDNTAYDFNVYADTNYGSLKLAVKNASANLTKWYVVVEYCEVM
jgi:hypothetical protein